MNADVLHQDMYAYDIYSEYLNKIKQYALNSNINSLSLRYYKQNIPLTTGTWNEIDVITTPSYTRTYDIFDFAPVLQMQPLSYQVQNDETNQGVIRRTQGVLTLLAVIEPLPGDVFNFYQHGSTDEFFNVDTVNFVYSVKDLNIYEITFSTANWAKKTVDELNINEHYYYVKEFQKFYDSSLYENYTELLNNRNALLDEINTKYDCIKMYYTDFVTINDMTYPLNSNQIDIVNSVLLYLNEKVKLKINLIDNKQIKYDENNLVLKITEDDTYVKDPNYIEPNTIDPSIPYDQHAGSVQSTLMKDVFILQNIYWKFINYQTPLDGNPDTTGLINSYNKDIYIKDAVKIIKDLDGNVINETNIK